MTTNERTELINLALANMEQEVELNGNIAIASTDNSRNDVTVAIWYAETPSKDGVADEYVRDLDAIADLRWAEQQFEVIEPTREAVAAFDASEDGARYKRITGMTMWENLGGDTL